MNTLLVLFAGNLSGEAAEPLIDGKNSLILALQRAQSFPGVGKTALLTGPEGDFSSVPAGIYIEKRDSWTVKALLEAIAAHSEGFDLTYFAWADCPFPDPELARKLAERHIRYAAEYSYADGWPYGLAPELLSPGTAAILAKILGDSDGGPVGRDALFSVIQKDINAFDIETEISPVDLRCHRLNLCADSRRNLLLLRRLPNARREKYRIPPLLSALSPKSRKSSEPCPLFIRCRFTAAAPKAVHGVPGRRLPAALLRNGGTIWKRGNLNPCWKKSARFPATRLLIFPCGGRFPFILKKWR